MAAYERLRIEIVRSAVTDLKNALRKSERLGCVCDEQKRLEGWFKSAWGQLLCGDNGEYIIEKCHKTYRTRSYANGKEQLPDDVQKQICEDYRNGVKTAVILKRYGITNNKLAVILRRWEK